jgi:hypothetical protein
MLKSFRDIGLLTLHLLFTFIFGLLFDLVHHFKQPIVFFFIVNIVYRSVNAIEYVDVLPEMIIDLVIL